MTARHPRRHAAGAAHRLLMGTPVNWREDAACRHADPDLFFPVGTAGAALHQIDEAKRICQTCPVRTACLAWALEHGVPFGIWGGTTEDERRALRRNVIRPVSASG